MSLDLSAYTSEYGVRLDILLKCHREILETVLPTLRAAIETVTDYMYEPDADNEENHEHMRAWATELMIDELTRLLLRDPVPASRTHAITKPNGIEYDTLIAAYSELTPVSARAFYADLLGASPDEYRAWLDSIPSHMQP